MQRARRSSVEGETEYAFKHLLVRDVAYGQVPRADRAEKHLRTAEWIESLGRPEDHAEMVANHYASGLELARAARQEVGAFLERARVAFRDAGARAATLHALPAAERYYADALELTPADDPEPPISCSSSDTSAGSARRRVATRSKPRWRGSSRAVNASARPRPSSSWPRSSGARGARTEWTRHMERARSLVAGTPASRIQAAVLTEASRYEMLANHSDAAVELGREAMQMAEELGLEDLRAQALNNVGSARGNAGDPAGLAEVEESIKIAKRINLIFEVLRGMNNAAAQHVIAADLEGRDEQIRELRVLAERYGYRGFLRFLDGGPGIESPYHLGNWDESLRAAAAFIADVEAGSPHYQAGNAYSMRALMRIARDDEAGALSDADRALELAPNVVDPQSYVAVLAHCGNVYERAGDERRASDVLETLLRSLESMRFVGFAVVKAQEVAWLARRFGRERELAPIIERETMTSRWLQAGKAIVDGDLRGAADVLADIGSLPNEAFFRLRAAEALVAEGRRAEADEQLHAALAFYRAWGLRGMCGRGRRYWRRRRSDAGNRGHETSSLIRFVSSEEGDKVALVRRFSQVTMGERQRVHGEVECGFSTFERDGNRYLQLDTYGWPERAIPGKVSQTIQLDEEGFGV